MCSLVDSISHPSAIATLHTPSNTPFAALPEGFTGAADGVMFHQVIPRPDGPQSIGACAVSVRHGGSEVVINMSLDEKKVAGMRSAAEVEALLAAAYPQLPSAWLRKLAETVKDTAVSEELRVRSGLDPQ